MSFVKKLKIARFCASILFAFVLVKAVTSPLAAAGVTLQVGALLSLTGVVVLTAAAIVIVFAIPCKRLYFGVLASLTVTVFLIFMESFLSEREMIWWYVLLPLEAVMILAWMLACVGKRIGAKCLDDFASPQVVCTMATNRFIKWMRDEWPEEMTMTQRLFVVARMAVLLALFATIVILGIAVMLIDLWA